MDWVQPGGSVWWNFASSENKPSPPLVRVVEECLISKKLGGKREIYIKQLRWLLQKFVAGRECVPIASISVADLDAFISARPVGSRNTLIARLGALFAFAEKRGYIDRNPIRRLDRAVVDQRPPMILSPERAKQFLDVTSAVQPKMLAANVIGIFAGVRPSELLQLEWASVDLSRGIVKIEAATSKVRRRRITPLQPAAIEWLKDCPKTGRVMPRAPVYRRHQIMKHLDWEWVPDVLRHCAASYLLALIQDVGKVSFMLGNSPSILLRHYSEIVTEADCKAFWEIRP